MVAGAKLPSWCSQYQPPSVRTQSDCSRPMPECCVVQPRSGPASVYLHVVGSPSAPRGTRRPRTTLGGHAPASFAGAAVGYGAASMMSGEDIKAKYQTYWPRKIMILFGPPGAGKGTHGPKIEDKLGISKAVCFMWSNWRPIASAIAKKSPWRLQ